MNWVDIAQVLEGFSTFAAAVVATIAIPFALAQGRRERELARLDRVNVAIQSYMDRRDKFYDPSSTRSSDGDDEWEQTFEVRSYVPNLENFVHLIDFTAKHLSEVSGPRWIRDNPSLLVILDKDLRHLDWLQAYECIQTFILDNAINIALGTATFKNVIANKGYKWDEGFEMSPLGDYPPRFVDHRPQRLEEPNYSRTLEWRVRMKRRIENQLLHHLRIRQKNQKLADALDRTRADLKLEPIERHPDDFGAVLPPGEHS